MTRLTVIISVLAIGLFVLADPSISQDKKGGGKPKGMLPAGFKALGLSKAQVEKIYTIQSEHRAKIAALNKQIEDLKAAESKEVFKVLTDDQRAQYLKSKGVDTKEKGSE